MASKKKSKRSFDDAFRKKVCAEYANAVRRQFTTRKDGTPLAEKGAGAEICKKYKLAQSMVVAWCRRLDVETGREGMGGHGG